MARETGRTSYGDAQVADFQHEIRTVIEYPAITIAAVIDIFNTTTLFVHGALLAGSPERFSKAVEWVKQRALTTLLANCTIVATRSSKFQSVIGDILHLLTNAWAPSLR